MKTSISFINHQILGLPRFVKRLIALIVDVCFCIFSVWISFYLRLGEFVPLSGNEQYHPQIAVVVSILFALPIFIISGLYRAIFRYSGWPALVAVGRSIALYGILYSAVFTAIGISYVPRTIGIIQPIIFLLMVGGSRAWVKFWLGHDYERRLKLGSLPRVMIYGAGSAGRKLAAALSNSHEMRVIGFIDDDNRLVGGVINGLTVYSSSSLNEIISFLDVTDVLLALPSITRHRRNEIIAELGSTHVSVRTLPSVVELAQGKVSISDIHELDIDDLLGREAVTPNQNLLEKNIVGKIVVVSGAGGSIGSELSRQIIRLGPQKILLIDQSEFALYKIHQELSALTTVSATAIIPLIASVQDEQRMTEIMSAWKPDTIYHAAAYKHVPLVEHNVVEGIKNNVFGTLKIARAAIKFGVSDFVLVSTDKAVRPTNIMGASKRLAELLLQALAAEITETKFTMVRFGNVLDSSGSVVPKFREQIRSGGPITLTHCDVTRFFMTIPEAAQLVIQAGAMATGGDVFVLDMGCPVKIIDLARRMIEFSGLSVRDEENPHGDIIISVTGLRPGEKLYEELLIGDNAEITSHPRIMRARENYFSWSDLENNLIELKKMLDNNDINNINNILMNLVAGYVPNTVVVDWLTQARGLKRQFDLGES